MTSQHRGSSVPKYRNLVSYLEDDKDTFTVHVRCGNCWHNYEVRVKKGVLVNESHLKFLKCKFCEVKGRLFRVAWNGITYVKLGDLK